MITNRPYSLPNTVELGKYFWDWSPEDVIGRTLLCQEALKDTPPIPTETVQKALDEIKKRPGGEQPVAQPYQG